MKTDIKANFLTNARPGLCFAVVFLEPRAPSMAWRTLQTCFSLHLQLVFILEKFVDCVFVNLLQSFLTKMPAKLIMTTAEFKPKSDVTDETLLTLLIRSYLLILQQFPLLMFDIFTN